MIGRLLSACAIAALCAAPAYGQELQTSDLNDGVHIEHFRVVVNGVQIADDAAVYLGDDETVYVSEDDLAAWQLKRPPKLTFQRNGLAYYGLQTDAQLATSYDRGQHELEIVAPRSAFIGQAAAGPPNIAPGRGAFLNYTLMRQSGSYDLYLAGRTGVFRMRYLSTAGVDGLEFHRGQTNWFRLDPVRHTVLSIGEGTSGDNWLGTNASFAGIHFASEYTSDPNYLAHGTLSVSGSAEMPSLLEIFIDNILVLRVDVRQGPFTVRDLPASAAHSDIVMVLTDATGNKTIQIARPTVDADFVAKGRTIYAFDAGIGEHNGNLKNTFYRGGVFEGAIRTGLTNRITGEVFAESIAGENFIDAGADVRLGSDQTLGFRIGGGNKRHAGQYRLNLHRGKFQLSEQFAYSSLRAEPIEGLDLGDVARLSENTDFSVTFSRRWSMGLRLDRSRDNQGSNSSSGAMRISYQSEGGVRIDVSPLYDFTHHLMSGNMSLSFAVARDRRVTERSAVTQQNQASAALEYRKDSSDPNDPISYEAQVSANQSQDRNFSIRDEMPWSSGSFRFQQQNGTRIYEPEISGAIAFVGSRFYALRTISSSESFGVVHLPGLKNVRVSVNSSLEGRTNSRGDLLLKRLSPWRDNTITVSEEDVPLNLNIRDPLHVFPASASPLDVTIPIVSRGGFIIEVVDESGAPLTPGSRLATAGTSYIVGYGGRSYITGVSSGSQQLTGSTATGACTVDVTVPAGLDDIPNLGRHVCRRLGR
jgi:outer membrane usher protein